MKRPEIAARVSASKKKQSQMYSELLTQRWRDGKMPKPKPLTKEQLRAVSERMKTNNPMKNPEIAARVHAAMKALFSNTDHKLRVLASQRISPNKLELEFTLLLDEMGLTQFKFTGDRSFWIGPCRSGKCRNPDFLDLKSKKVILLCGRHWHTEQSIAIQVADYEEKRYKVMVVWDNELDGMELEKKLTERVKRFALE